MNFKKTFFSDTSFVWLGALLLLSFFLLYFQIRSLNASADYVNNSNKIKLKLEEAISTLKDAETGQRGFLLTHDSLFLQPYYSSTRIFKKDITELDSVLSDQPEQQEYVNRIERLGEKRTEALNLLIYIDSKSAHPASPYYQHLAYGRMLMDSLRQTFHEMIILQDKLLEERIEKRNRNTFITPLYASIFFVIVLFVFILSFLRVKSELNEQTRLRVKIDDAKKFLDSILNTTPNAIIVYDAVAGGEEITDFVIIHINKAPVYHTLSLEELKGTSLYTIFPQAKEHGIFQNFVDVLNDGKSREFEFAHFDGKENHWLQASVSKLNNGITASFTNITEIKKASLKLAELNSYLNRTNAELRDARQFLETLLDSSVDIIIAYDERKNFILLNKNAEKEYGISRSEVLGKNISDVLPMVSHSQNTEDLEKALQGTFIHNEEIESAYKNKFYENFYIPLKNDHCVSGVLVIIRDITLFVQASRQIRINTQILERKNIELEQSNQELASFSYVASHDLQEPLRKMQSFTSRILSVDGDRFSPATKDYFERIVSAAGRMQNLIDALLNFSRTSTSELKFEKVDINLMLEEVKQILKENIEEKKAVIDSTPLPVIYILPVQFQQLLVNLISNALKYSRKDVVPHISISADIVPGTEIDSANTRIDKNYWKFTVADNGIGFEQQYSKKIFELFQRLHGRTEYSGTGIGLAICKKIVHNHEGVITANGVPDKGAAITFYLPVSRE